MPKAKDDSMNIEQQPCSKLLRCNFLGLTRLLVGSLVLLLLVGCTGKKDKASNAPDSGPSSSNVQTSKAVPSQHAEPDLPRPPGMVWIPGGKFVMGAENDMARPDEGPSHMVFVDGFYMDVNEITNDQFAAFITATGFVTTAEKIPTMAEMATQQPPNAPPIDPATLVAGSLVFSPPDQPVPTDVPQAHYQWWSWAPDTNWRNPKGPDSNLDGLGNHPVVHVSWDDAVAYCKWASRRLPTEAEWEFAARGGIAQAKFVWGKNKASDDKPQANIWQGQFPNRNALIDGYEATAPVGKFPKNGYGLNDMAGNVWEWCSDWYRADTYRLRVIAQDSGLISNPPGPDTTDHPYEPRKVKRGGSFLCHRDYCSSYRPSARMHTPRDTGSSHSGFRAVMTEAMWREHLNKQGAAKDEAKEKETPQK